MSNSQSTPYSQTGRSLGRLTIDIAYLLLAAVTTANYLPVFQLVHLFFKLHRAIFGERYPKQRDRLHRYFSHKKG